MSAVDKLEFALGYAGAGWPVFPCKADKKPLTEHGLLDATTDPEQITAWWTRWPKANIGGATGRVSGRVALDVDVKKGAPGLESLEALVHELGDGIQDTVVVRTPTQGLHYYYRQNGDEIRNSTGKLGPGLDVRGDGGYVLLPGSETADGPYELLTADREPAALPAALAKKMIGEARLPAAPVTEGTIPEHERNNTLASLAGTMRRRGMTPQAITAALLEENKRCDPPLPEKEVRVIAGSVAGYPPAEPTAAPSSEGYDLAPLDWLALLRDGIPPVEYISEPYLPKGARIWVWGATGTAKSLWCLWQAAKLSREGVRVAYFSEENPIQEDIRRLGKLQPDPDHFKMYQRTGIDLADPEWVAAMLQAIKGDAIVFFDSLTDLWSGDESDNRDVQMLDATVSKAVQSQGATPVFIHHTGHRQMFSDRGGATAGRGASTLGQKADVVLEFKDAGEGRFIIVYGKCRLGGIRVPQRCFQVDDGAGGRLEIVDASDPEQLAVVQLAEKMVEAVLTAGPGRLTTNELRTTVGGKSERQTAALALLAEDSRVRCGVEKITTRDNRHRDSKVWRPSREPLGDSTSLFEDGVQAVPNPLYRGGIGNHLPFADQVLPDGREPVGNPLHIEGEDDA